jgi:hypothetical protein
MKYRMGNHPPEVRRKDGSDYPQPAKPLENDKIRGLRAKANRTLYVMALFIALSIGAIRDFAFLPSLSPRIHLLLGEGPSAGMISSALLIYIFSATILILSRMMSGSGKYGGFTQLGYLSGFYLFYHFSGAMEEYFWAVFAAGITILGLESYQVWTWCREEIRIQEEILAELERNRPKDDKPDD